jgi:hypothetical protein
MDTTTVPTIVQYLDCSRLQEPSILAPPPRPPPPPHPPHPPPICITQLTRHQTPASSFQYPASSSRLPALRHYSAPNNLNPRCDPLLLCQNARTQGDPGSLPSSFCARSESSPPHWRHHSAVDHPDPLFYQEITATPALSPPPVSSLLGVQRPVAAAPSRLPTAV